MSERPTPETNAFSGNLGDWIKFAEKLERERDEAREALRDMLSGWKYIRSVHGDLCGVGWDRAQSKAEAALEGAK